jgi:hypothetical protein
LLQIKDATTTPHHPQCNLQAEVQNKRIQKYLATFVDKMTLDYNTALHRLIKCTPFFLSYGIEQTWPKCGPPNFFCGP